MQTSASLWAEHLIDKEAFELREAEKAEAEREKVRSTTGDLSNYGFQADFPPIKTILANN